MLQQPSNFLTDEYYNPRKLRLTKIKINEVFTTKIFFHNMKKLYRNTFFRRRGTIFLGGLFPGGNFPAGTFPRAIFPGGIFPGGIFPSTKVFHLPSVNLSLGLDFQKQPFRNVFQNRFLQKFRNIHRKKSVMAIAYLLLQNT